MWIVLVHESDVVEDILLVLEHALQAALDDYRDFVRERRVIRDAVRNGGCQDVTVAVLVLQTFTVEGGAAGGGAEQKATCATIASRPREVANALESEHRVIDVKGDHWHVAGAVRSRGGNPRRHGTRLVDAFLEDLPVLVLLVEHQLVRVLRTV